MWEVDLAETATAQSGAAVPEIMGERRNARRLNSDVSVFEGFDPMQSLRKNCTFPHLGAPGWSRGVTANTKAGVTEENL